MTDNPAADNPVTHEAATDNPATDNPATHDAVKASARTGPASGPGARPRRAFVLGAGGVLGFAWTLGALSALESVADVSPGDAEIVVGTSAGAVAAALLGLGLSVEAIRRHHDGIPAPGDPVIEYDHDRATGAALPPWPGFRPASPGLALRAIRRPGSVSPLVALTGLVPAGRGSLSSVHALVDGVAKVTGWDDRWPDRPRPWIVATDHRSGRRIVFGRDELPGGQSRPTRAVRRARLADAVLASCSIPGWYPPVVIDGVPYIDGGAVSNASLDVLGSAGVDEVFVIAPMAATELDSPRRAVVRLERRVRRAITRRILADAEALRAGGVRVCFLAPAAEDLRVIGVNMMDATRRARVLDVATDSAARQLRRQLGTSGGWDARAAGGGTA